MCQFESIYFTLLLKKLPNSSLKIYCLKSSGTIYESSKCFTFWSTFGIANLFYFRLCSGCKRVFLCELCLYFPDNHGCGTPLFVFIGHWCIYLCMKEVSVQLFPPLFLMNYLFLLIHRSTEEWTHWKRPWCWERLKVGEGDDRGWDGWMASPTRWTRVWVISRSWWWTGRPGML